MSAPTTSDELRNALFTAILQGDDNGLDALCKQYAGAVVDHFEEWKKVPAEIRADEQSTRAWVHCVMTIATLFEAHGIPTLMQQLSGGSDNLIERWRGTLARAIALSQNGDYDASNELLEPLRVELVGAQGDVVDEFRPKTFGTLGKNAFYLGRRQQAVNFMRMALDDCTRSGDAAGVRAYSENLRVLTAASAAESDDAASLRLLRIRALIARAQDLSDAARYDQSCDSLDQTLREIDAAGDGPGSEYRGKALGLLGLNRFRMGDRSKAREHTAAALEDCRTRSDADGVRAYSANLAYLEK
jgi:hypothetical protein